MNPSTIFAMQFPNKILQLVAAKGYRALGATYKKEKRSIQLEFSSALVIIIMPRHVLVNGCEVADKDLEAHIQALPEVIDDGQGTTEPSITSRNLLRSMALQSDVNKRRRTEGSGINILGWSIRRDRHGYYRAYRRVDGKLLSRYLGKGLDDAKQKLTESA